MCKKQKGLHNRIDFCMKPLIEWLKYNNYNTVASCCGHGKYQMTVIIDLKDGGMIELFTDTFIPRKRNFYKKDKQGFYFIPEVEKK